MEIKDLYERLNSHPGYTELKNHRSDFRRRLATAEKNLNVNEIYYLITRLEEVNKSIYRIVKDIIN